MIENISTQLERVQKAIATIETGAQEYTIGTRKLTKADLATLYNREADLKAALAAEQHGVVTFAQIGRL